MTVRELARENNFEPLLLINEEQTVSGAYAGDLLSWVMGRAEEGNAFLTIMTNINVIAVATLAELSCVVFCENVPVGDDLLSAARQKKINLLRSAHPLYETCVMVGNSLK